jgi:hypothetical protein
MDILTPKGQVTAQQEQLALTMFRAKFDHVEFIETPKHEPADIDGFVVANDVISCGVEVKCRNMTASELKNQFGNRWLITADKLERGMKVCRSLCVPFRGFLYLVPDKMLLIVPIWDPTKGWNPNIDHEYTETQATVNGGTARRLNAYVDVSGATVIAEL